MIGAEPESCASVQSSLSAGALCRVTNVSTFMEGVAMQMNGDGSTFPFLAWQDVSMMTCTEAEIAAATVSLLQKESWLVEPSGAIALAGLVLLTGGNFEKASYARLLAFPFTPQTRLARLLGLMSERPRSGPRRDSLILTQVMSGPFLLPRRRCRFMSNWPGATGAIATRRPGARSTSPRCGARLRRWQTMVGRAPSRSWRRCKGPTSCGRRSQGCSTGVRLHMLSASLRNFSKRGAWTISTSTTSDTQYPARVALTPYVYFEVLEQIETLPMLRDDRLSTYDAEDVAETVIRGAHDLLFIDPVANSVELRVCDVADLARTLAHRQQRPLCLMEEGTMPPAQLPSKLFCDKNIFRRHLKIIHYCTASINLRLGFEYALNALQAIVLVKTRSARLSIREGVRFGFITPRSSAASAITDAERPFLLLHSSMLDKVGSDRQAGVIEAALARVAHVTNGR